MSRIDKYVTSFSFSKTDFQDMIKVGERSGKQFADFIFQDFDYDNVQKRVHEYITNHLELRSKKSGDGLMTFVDFTNSLYKLKDES